jgi:hypothetical protein
MGPALVQDQDSRREFTVNGLHAGFRNLAELTNFISGQELRST